VLQARGVLGGRIGPAGFAALWAGGEVSWWLQCSTAVQQQREQER